MISLTYDSTTLELPADLQWTNEFTWQRVDQRTEYSITGALIVDTFTRQAGQPITLQPSDDRAAWMSRELLRQLRTLANVAGQEMTLELRGETHTVLFDQEAGPIEAVPVVDFSNPKDHHKYSVTLRFIKKD